jgi:predicted outer membrane repeat protein
MKRQANTLTALIGTILLGGASLAQAGEQFNVIFAGTTVDGMDAFDGFCSLREAIHNANNNTQFSLVDGECPPGSAVMTDVVRLAAGETYFLDVAGEGADEGDLDLFQNVALELDLRIDTDGVAPSTIQQTVAGQRVLENLGLTVEIDNIILSGGSVPDGVGGGILNEGGVMRLSRSTVMANSAISGAGIYSNGSLSLSNSEVVLNTASLLGGGLLNDGGSLDLIDSQVRANQSVTAGGIYNVNGEANVQGSTLNLNSATGGDGGAILNAGSGQLLVLDSSFEGNTASAKGGAIHNESTEDIYVGDSSFASNNAVLGGAISGQGSADVRVAGSTFRENSSASDGGAIHATHAVVGDSTFEDNTAFLGDGGAIFAATGVTMARSTLRGNSADEGGAVHVQIGTLTDCLLEDNHAGSHGGGLYTNNFVQMERVRFVDNSAAGNGGGYYQSGTVIFGSDIRRSVFTGNQAGAQGGGLWTGGETRIGNTTIHNNAAAAGGGMYIAAGADVTAVNMTLAGHLAGQDLHKFGKLTMGNSIIFTPGQPDCETTLEDPPIYTLGHNIVDDNSCFFDQSLPSDQLLTDPRLEALADNGGGTLTLALAPDSPAIDAGSDVLCASEPVDGVDQRGGERPQGAACDIGAFEVGAIQLEDAIFANGFE